MPTSHIDTQTDTKHLHVLSTNWTSIGWFVASPVLCPCKHHMLTTRLAQHLRVLPTNWSSTEQLIASLVLCLCNHHMLTPQLTQHNICECYPPTGLLLEVRFLNSPLSIPTLYDDNPTCTTTSVCVTYTWSSTLHFIASLVLVCDNITHLQHNLLNKTSGIANNPLVLHCTVPCLTGPIRANITP